MLSSAKSRIRSSGVSQAIRYLVSPRFRREAHLATEVFESIPREGLDQIRSKYQNNELNKQRGPISHANTGKYLDARFWLQDAAQRVISIGLNEDKPRRVLDLGCGAGYFLMMARHFGHDVTGLDLPTNDMYNELIQLFKLTRIDHQIEPYTPLPDLGPPLDLITGFMIWFNWTGRADGWNADEWKYFIDDCRSRLNPGGRIWLELNPGRRKDRYLFMPDETAARLRKLPGVTVTPGKSLITTTFE